MKQSKFIVLGAVSCLTLAGCSHASRVEQTSPPTAPEQAVIRYEYKTGEITQICADEMKKTDERIMQMLQIPKNEKSFVNTFEAYEQITADLGENTNAPTFMNYVSLDKKLREESQACEAQLGQYVVALMSRRDIYDALTAAKKNTKMKELTPEQLRLVDQTLKSFKRNGLFLSDAKLKEVRELKQKLSTLETKFASNLNENTDFEEMSVEDLAGVPESVINRFTKLPNGKYKVTTKSTDYVPFMENAKSSEARRRMAVRYENRAADVNTHLLQEAISLRQKIAKLLGYKTWADYQTEERMAKNADSVLKFLNSLRGKVAVKNKQDLAKLLKFKKESVPTADRLDPWDGTHFSYQLKKRDYSLDNEVIREYFPAERAVGKMFEIYSRIFGVSYVEVKDAKVWAPHVKLYETRNAKTGEFISHFFTDFVPREGKYGHAAAFTLVPGRMVDGKYRSPVSSIVANFNPPSGGKPSLLTHDEVETLFHEFGHIMHQTLTRAHYASLAGSSVARDFVEAPSQMLENWVWDKDMIKDLSGHYLDPNRKLPDEQIEKLIATREFNQGYFYTRQLLFALFDMELHTAKKPIDPISTYKRLYKELTTITPLPETHFPAGFNHLMGGYDAGYYGYLWSEVFAQDMFTRFQKAGLLNSKVGLEYRERILEQGDTAPADKLLVSFLGRKPNTKAFFKRLGIK